MDSSSMTPHIVEGANPTPLDFQTEIYRKGLHYEKPPLTFRTDQWEIEARETLDSRSWGYVNGNAGTGQTYRNNLQEFQKWAFVPKRLVPSGFSDLSVELFGKKYPYPLALAPIGVQRIFHSDGEHAVAQAAAAEHVPYIYSTAASTSIEDAALSNGDGHRWYQLYWPENQHNEFTASMLQRAQSSGYDVLVVTLDTYIFGWITSDMDNGYSPFLRTDNIGVAIGFSDPVYRRFFRERYGKEIEDDMQTAAAVWAKIFIPGFAHSFEDLRFLREHWRGPIVLKGIQCVEDAIKAVDEYGIEGIYVSNHGGRQCDANVASLSVLAEIADAVGDRAEIIFDSGVRYGGDVAKALALGAKMVCLGRAYIYGLALAGEEGVRHVIRSILGELDLTLHLSGVPSVRKDALNKSRLRSVT